MTCDLTIKRDRYIYKRYESYSDLESNLKPQLQGLVNLQKETGVKIGILEAPPIFTREWNRLKDCHDWEIQDDKDLNEQVKKLNLLVREINSDLGYRSPRFLEDFVKSRKDKKTGKTRYSLSEKLLIDGVHPNELTAKKWLVQIVKSTTRGR